MRGRLIENFLDYLTHERAYSPHTVTSYGSDLDEFASHLEEIGTDLDLAHADADLVRGWAMTLMGKGRNATSVNRKLSALRTFYKYLLKKGEIEVSPMQNIHGPKKKKPLPQFVREKDMDRLLDDGPAPTTWQEARNRLIIQMFYETGIRLSELVGLDESDVDFGRKVIKVTGKRNKQRIIPIGDGLIESLRGYMEVKEWQGADGDCRLPLFITDKGVRVSDGWVYRLVHEKLSQVVTLKKRSPHVLRHTFATAMLNGDAELEAVKELMGHESVSTTQIYTHTTFEELKKAYKQAHPRASINH